MENYTSSHAIIKALKGAEDPPSSSSPPKIEIARMAWESNEIHFPSKDEVLVEWVLTSFIKHSKDARGSSSEAPVLSAEHWSLLGDILSARQSRLWLSSLLIRIPVLNVMTTFFKCAPFTDLGRHPTLTNAITHSVHAVWQQATARMNLEGLTDCLGSVLEYFASNSTQINDLASVCLLVARSFKQAVGNMTGKKKALSWFMEKSYLHWVHLVCLESSVSISLNRESKLFISEICQAGIDVIFYLDSLKSSIDPLKTILTEPKYSLRNMKESQYKIVPMLYSSYVRELQRHRFAVFGSGSGQNNEQAVRIKVRDAGVRGFEVCYRALRERGDHLEVWKNVSALVEVLEQANIVGYGITEQTVVLNEVADSAVEVLTRSQDRHDEVVNAALQILCAVSRVDFDFLNPFLSKVLSGLLTMNPSVYPSTVTLLHIVLDFHSKTRTIPSYLEILFGALSDADVPHVGAAIRAHQCCTSGALLSLSHLEELSRCIRGFLTPGQTQGIVDLTFTFLLEAWREYSDNSTAGMGKMDVDAVERGTKTKLKKSDSLLLASLDSAALGYSLVARAVAVIVPSLPYSSLSEAILGSVRASISSAWQGTLNEAAQIAFSISKQSGAHWAPQCVSAATLRIRHALLTCPALHNVNLPVQPVATITEISGYIRSSQTDPELVIEMLRAFFDADFLNCTPEEHDAVTDAMITHLETNWTVRNPSGQYGTRVESSWDGSTSSLNSLEPGCHQRGALAIWQLLLDRWLPLIDEIAPRKHLERIVKLIFKKLETTGSLTQSNQITLQWLLDGLLHSAVFWELPNLRDAIISHIESITQYADWESFPKLLKQAQNPRKVDTPNLPINWTIVEVESILGAFSTLLRAPRDYLPRSARVTFVRRAVVADLALSGSKREVSGEQTAVAWKAIVVIRAWIVSMFDAFDVINVITVDEDRFREYVVYLMLSDSAGEGAGDEFHVMTLELLSSIFSHAVHSAVYNKADLLKSLCASLQNPKCRLSEQARLRFIEVLVSECTDINKLSTPSKDAIGRLYSDMHAKYSDTLSEMLNSMPEITSAQGTHIRSWRICVVLRRWLNVQERKTNGIQLVQKMMATQSNLISGDEVNSFYTEIFLLLLEELHSLPGNERELHLSLMAAAYILFIGRLHIADRSVCDMALMHSARSLSVNELSDVLGLIREALKKGLASNDETRTALHFSSVLVGDAPEGSMKITQEHFEDCLHVFLDDSKFVIGDSELCLEGLGFIGKVCSERPAYLRHAALGPIWLILTKVLTGSTTHTNESHPYVLHNITTIAGSIIRLRRDLITSTLPMLGMVLTSLLRSLCAPRPQLGTRQHKQVSDTLPWWVSPKTPLGLSEARAVARLLTTLQAKTIPRTFTSRDKSRKDKERTAESLLGAFSKHAPPVLGAYINMLVDPLIVVDANMREALAPGLFALCKAMGEHGRDSLMVSGCDAAGKTVFKAIWKEYAKQRYVGKG